ERKPKLSFKEQKEMEALEQELESLEKEKKELESAMSSGTMTVDAITAAGARMEEIIDRLDEAEFRMLELMEKEG
ncbi:MAG: ABC transporter ATP-binding protein, partial [Muribaculaceae bacterium]|nr:ABC transporter ATP-binding protein [Muribaculaceae bacterium]